MKCSRVPEPNIHAVERAGVWRWTIGLREKDERCTNCTDYCCADQAVARRSVRVCVLRSYDSDNQASGDHAGDPRGVIVSLGLPNLSRRFAGSIEIHSRYLSSIEAVADALRITGRVAEQIGFRDAAEEAMEHAVVGGSDDDRPPRSETPQSIP